MSETSITEPVVVPPPATETASEKIELSPAQLSDRLARHTRAQMKQLFGTEDGAALRDRLSRLDALEQQEEQRKKESMSEIERMRAEKDEALSRAAQFEQERDARAFEATITRASLKAGIKNLEYATFAVIRATDALSDGESLDLDTFFADQLKDPSAQAAYGFAAAVRTAETPATTTPTAASGQPPAAPAPGQPAPTNDAFAMSDKDWAIRRAQFGLR
jgi:hypothetical protein